MRDKREAPTFLRMNREREGGKRERESWEIENEYGKDPRYYLTLAQKMIVENQEN